LTGRRVVVWRHGRTAWNLERRFQGQYDLGLDDVGLVQARNAAAVLATLQPVKIVSSDLLRARTTAHELAGLTGLVVSTDAGLREIDVGSWQGLTLEEVAARNPADAELWISGREGRRGGGETMAEVADRARAALDLALADVTEHQTLVLATHGAAGRALLSSLMALPSDRWHSVGSLANACWSVALETPEGWRLAEHNVGPNQYESIAPQPPAGDDR
jgi:broad specificity phosphatase PhoE